MSPFDAPLDVEARIAELREQIHRHNDLYYGLGEPEISDSEYDGLFKALQDLEAQRPDLITPDSPTQRVGTIRFSGHGSATFRPAVPIHLEVFSKVPHDRPVVESGFGPGSR